MCEFGRVRGSVRRHDRRTNRPNFPRPLPDTNMDDRLESFLRSKLRSPGYQYAGRAYANAR